MKKILFALLLMPGASFAQKLEKYCELVATGRLFSSKVTIAVDYGEEAGFFKDRRVKDDDGKAAKFKTLTDALNYMGTQGWKLVNAFPISNGSENVYHFFFKKEYDATELATPAETK